MLLSVNYSLIGGYMDALGYDQPTSPPADKVTVVFCGFHKYQLQKIRKKLHKQTEKQTKNT